MFRFRCDITSGVPVRRGYSLNTVKNPFLSSLRLAFGVSVGLASILGASATAPAQAAPTFITPAQGRGADLNIRGGTVFGSGNFGDHQILRVRNTADLGNARKSYVRFDLASLPAPAKNATSATLGLQLAPSEGKSPADRVWTFNVYGLKDGSAGENWDEKSVNWNNAPANVATSPLDLTPDTTLLGNFTITGTGKPGQIVQLSSAALLKFLQSDTNGEVTLILARREAGEAPEEDVMHIFASKEYATTAPPVLSVAYNGEMAALPNALQWASLPAVTPPLPFENDIQAFEAADKQNMPAKGGVLFVGSSSIRLWNSLKQDFPNLNVINRGFGGSHIIDSVHFADRIVTPYAPKMIVFYAGTNDLADGEKPEVLLGQYMEFVAKVRAKQPTVPIAFIAVSPAPSRWDNAANIRKTNALIEQFCSLVPGLSYIDTFSLMLDANGQPIPELFVGDRLHMTPKGYAIWAKTVAPYLPKP